MPRTCSFVIPGDWSTPTGGYRYDRRIVLGLRDAGWRVDHCALHDGFPWPDAHALADAERRFAALPDGARVVVDGLAFGALAPLVRRHAARLRWVALVHHPLHLEIGLDAAMRASLFAQEQSALRSARQVIVTSAATADDVARMGVPAERIAVVEPGTDVPAPRHDMPRTGPTRLLCVASLVPRKGHALLLEALAGLPGLDWTLHCIGSTVRDPVTATRLQSATQAAPLAGRVHWHGEVDDATLAAHYAAADLFVLPSLHEGYGMAVAEALAAGLPVIASDAGALAQTLPAAAGRQVAAGDVGALRQALTELIADPAERARCSAAAQSAREHLPSWQDAAARFAGVLEGVA